MFGGGAIDPILFSLGARHLQQKVFESEICRRRELSTGLDRPKAFRVRVIASVRLAAFPVMLVLLGESDGDRNLGGQNCGRNRGTEQSRKRYGPGGAMHRLIRDLAGGVGQHWPRARLFGCVQL